MKISLGLQLVDKLCAKMKLLEFLVCEIGHFPINIEGKKKCRYSNSKLDFYIMFKALAEKEKSLMVFMVALISMFTYRFMKKT